MKLSKLLVGASAIAFATGVASAQVNTSQYSQTGSGNVATVDNTASGNIGNSSTITQNGNGNTATVFERGFYNLSFIQQIGSSDEVVHQQSGNGNSADTRESGDNLKSAVAQVGNSNTATIRQSGGYNISTLRQGYALDASVPSGENRPADYNTATVDQAGYGLSSQVGQRAASATATPASRNGAYVYQRSASISNSVQDLSRIVQESPGNYAELYQYDGTVASPNSSTITQRNSSATTTAASSSNWASVAEQGAGQTTALAQDGLLNSATVRMQGGGSAVGAGNQATLTQTGNDLWIAYNLRPLGGAGATGNAATVQQTGNNHTATIYQFGTGDQVTVSQANGANTGVYAAGGTAQAQAFESQNAQADTATLAQTGDNYGEVVQGFGGGSSVTLSQTDAGDLNGARTRNSAVATQYGNGNSARIDQNAIGASATTWQQMGSSADAITIGQGTGGTALSSTTGVSGFAAGPQGVGASKLSANITQAGAYNSATVYQDGSNLAAQVSQYGGGANGFPNKVFVSQTGSANSATAYQGSGVGASAAGDPASGNSSSQNAGGPADEFYFAGGVRSAEIDILQTASGNSASVYQYGRGQSARVEQQGTNNIAGVLQEVGATNASAVIRQSGTSNSYYIDQNTAGQYISVTQTGSNNLASNIQRGSTSGSAGFTPPPGFPAQ